MKTSKHWVVIAVPADDFWYARDLRHAWEMSKHLDAIQIVSLMTGTHWNIKNGTVPRIKGSY